MLFAGLAVHSGARAGIGMHIETGRSDNVTQFYDTACVNSPYQARTTFALSLVASEIGLAKFTYDVYYGVMLPDKTVVSWQPVRTPDRLDFKLLLGLLPLVRGESLYIGEQSLDVRSTNVAAGHLFTPADPLGEYLIFVL